MKQLIIQPREAGKTSWLINEFIKNVLNNGQVSYYIVHNNNIKKNIQKICEQNGYYTNCVFTSKELLERGANLNSCIFIDDYFQLLELTDRRNLTKYIMEHNLDFIAISTPDKLYDIKKLNDIKAWRNLKKDSNLYNILKTKEQMEDDFGIDYFYNFLSYSNVYIDEYNKDKLLYHFKKYETEVLGNIYKTD